MKRLVSLSAIATALLFSACSSQEEMAPKQAPTPAPAAKAPSAKSEAKAPAEKPADGKAPEKSAEKAKATKLAGDVGLLDTEKNYMIIVSKDGKLVTIDFDPKFQPTELKPESAKVADIGLGSQAVVQYTKQGDKNVATSVEYRPAKGE
jgi:major membrane immunogen (membrane-anchored lipoprotein)